MSSSFGFFFFVRAFIFAKLRFELVLISGDNWFDETVLDPTFDKTGLFGSCQ